MTQSFATIHRLHCNAMDRLRAHEKWIKARNLSPNGDQMLLKLNRIVRLTKELMEELEK